MSKMNTTDELTKALMFLFTTEKYSDLTIICGPKSYAVHRAILCPRSSFFDAACGGRFREAQTGIIDLSEDDPDAVKHMINYFYKMDYLTVSTASLPTPSHFSRRNPPKKLNLNLIQDPLLATAAAISPSSPPPLSAAESSTETTPLASPYDANTPITSNAPEWTAKPLFSPSFSPEVAEDKTSAINSLPHSLDSVVRASSPEPTTDLVTHARVYAIAEKYGVEGLKTLAMRKFAAEMNAHHDSDEIPEAMVEVYENTVDSDRGLRDVIIQAVRTHPEIVRRQDVGNAIKETPTLAYELFRVGWGLPIVGCQ